MIIGPRSTNAGEELPLTAEQREHANTLDFESLKAYLTELQIAHLGLVQDPLLMPMCTTCPSRRLRSRKGSPSESLTRPPGRKNF